MAAENLVGRFVAAGFGELPVDDQPLAGTRAMLGHRRAIDRNDIPHVPPAGRRHNQPDFPVPELKEIVHRLLCAGMIIATHEIQIAAFEFVIDHNDWMPRRLKFVDETVMVAEAKQQRPGRPAVVDHHDVPPAADIFRADPLEEYVVSHRRRLLGYAADQFAKVRIGEARSFIRRLRRQQNRKSRRRARRRRLRRAHRPIAKPLRNASYALLVAALMRGFSLSTSETVAIETPAARAMSHNRTAFCRRGWRTFPAFSFPHATAT